MRVAVISDQHGNLPPIPKCDLLVVSGDMTGANPHGPRDDSDSYWRGWFTTEWMRWRAGVPTVAIAGNHDTCFQFAGPPNTFDFWYLCDLGCRFGGFNFWGAPWIREWDQLAFNLADDAIRDRFALVPNGTDVVVCHMPPLGAGDTLGIGAHPVGSLAIADMVHRVQPALLTCGHIHESRGVYRLGSTKIVNAACGFIEVDL